MGERIYQVGEIVRISFVGTVVDVSDEAGAALRVQYADEEHMTVVTVPMPPDFEIARLAPADGEPRPGDVWRAGDGILYFARAGLGRTAGRAPVYLVDQLGGSSVEWMDVYRQSGLTLVWRAPEAGEFGA